MTFLISLVRTLEKKYILSIIIRCTIDSLNYICWNANAQNASYYAKEKPSTIRMAFIQQLAWNLFTFRNP